MTNVFQTGSFKTYAESSIQGRGPDGGTRRRKRRRGPEGYYISSGWWIIWFLADTMPKEAKAAVIELCGDLPGPGEVFKATKDMGNQYEIEQKEVYNLPAAFKKCDCRFNVTKLLGQQGDKVIRFIQEDGSTRHVTAISEIFMNLIDPAAVDYDNGEYEPFGPVALCPTSPFMYWGNNQCYLMAGVRTAEEGEEADFWKFLEGTEIL